MIPPSEAQSLRDAVARAVYEEALLQRDNETARANRATFENITAEAQVATLTARIAEATETFTDEAGNVWSPPTAWAYFAACRALHAKTARLAEMEATLGQIVQILWTPKSDGESIAQIDRAARSALSNKDADHE